MAGQLTTATIDSGAASTPPVFNASGTQIGTLCRAWVQFNGTSGASPVIRASFNVSSVTRTATGTYTVAFTNNMPDANYAAVGSSETFSGSLAITTTNGGGAAGVAGNTISSCKVQTSYVANLTGGSGTTDMYFVSVAIFR